MSETKFVFERLCVILTLNFISEVTRKVQTKRLSPMIRFLLEHIFFATIFSSQKKKVICRHRAMRVCYSIITYNIKSSTFKWDQKITSKKNSLRNFGHFDRPFTEVAFLDLLFLVWTWLIFTSCRGGGGHNLSLTS